MRNWNVVVGLFEHEGSVWYLPLAHDMKRALDGQEKRRSVRPELCELLSFTNGVLSRLLILTARPSSGRPSALAACGT
jgi:hypothetical protein